MVVAILLSVFFSSQIDQELNLIIFILVNKGKNQYSQVSL